MLPDDRRYSREHEWIRPEGDGMPGVIGLTEFAVTELGDIVYVELPAVGATLDPVRELRRGRIGQGGERPLRAGRWDGGRGQRGPPRPARALNSDPHGAGWICRITLAEPERAGGAPRRCRPTRALIGLE